jgi:hypothetical protein
LEEIHIPDTVKYTREQIFDGCGIKKIKFYGELERVEKYLVKACRKLEYIEIPYIKTIKDLPLFWMLDCNGNAAQRTKILFNVSDSENHKKAYSYIDKCTACTETSEFAYTSPYVSAKGYTFYLTTLNIMGSEYTSSTGHILEGLKQVTDLRFSPECRVIKILPLFSSGTGYKLKRMYINNIFTVDKTIYDNFSWFPEDFDSSQVTIYVSWSNEDYPE